MARPWDPRIHPAWLVPGAIALRRAHTSRQWPSATGTIVYGKLDSSTTAARNEDDEVERSTTYGARMVYTYEAGGARRFSNRRRFGQLAGADEEWAAEIAAAYPPGAQVRVAYSPDDPDLAVLEPGISSEAYWLPGAGAAFLLFGLAVRFFAIPALTRGP